jgi:putative glutamine amidotransferase
MRPLIGITSDFGLSSLGQPQAQLNSAYSRAVIEAGAAPLVIPWDLEPEACASLIARLDGILLSGGGDIEPWRYHGDTTAPLTDVSPARDELEFSLVRMALDSRKPFLGICRGCQVVNVALGGSLHEDLDTNPPSAIRHNVSGKESRVPAHDVVIEPNTGLAAALDRLAFGVNSHHHQGLKEIAAGLRVAARAPDGLVEAVELTGHPFGLAVQWHPERMTHQEWTRKLFSTFVSAAAAH